jgi:hypothetical protein
MTDDRDFERRLGDMLHAEAPAPPPDLAERLLRQTARTPQRRGWLGSISLAPVLAAAVLALAVVVGIQVGQLLEGPPVGGEPTPIPTGSTPPVSSATPQSTPPATPSPSPGAFPGGQRCANESDGYTVEYPADWYANEEIPPSDELDGIAACRFFASAPFVVQPNAGLPASVAIGFQRVADEPPVAGVMIRSETVTVAGHSATVREYEAEPGGFTAPGTVVYEYLVPLDGGEVLVIGTDSSREGDYDEHRDVLDRMMETLSLDS